MVGSALAKSSRTDHCRAGTPSNKRMKLTSLSAAPGQMKAPPRALRHFAAVRTGSQLIRGVGRTLAEGGGNVAGARW
jgi:hypothetical protein